MLEIRNLYKSFSRKAPPALQDVSFSVERGKICGLLGHNGAGKSTVLGSMLGLVYPDRGEVIIGGCSVQKNRETAMRKTGAIFEAPNFYEYLSGWKNLKILTAFSGGVSHSDIEKTVEWVGLSERIHHRVGTYSHGMRQRLGLAQALLPEPEFLLLDEPTDGLDPGGIVEFREKILELRDRLGLTVLLSSHLLAEVDQICDQIVMLCKGRLVFDGPASGFSGDADIYRIKAENATEEQIATAIGLSHLPGGGFTFPPDVSVADVLEQLVVEKKIRVTEFSPLKGSLESKYLDLTQGED